MEKDNPEKEKVEGGDGDAKKLDTKSSGDEAPKKDTSMEQETEPPTLSEGDSKIDA